MTATDAQPAPADTDKEGTGSSSKDGSITSPQSRAAGHENENINGNDNGNGNGNGNIMGGDEDDDEKSDPYTDISSMSEEAEARGSIAGRVAEIDRAHGSRNGNGNGNGSHSSHANDSRSPLDIHLAFSGDSENDGVTAQRRKEVGNGNSNDNNDNDNNDNDNNHDNENAEEPKIGLLQLSHSTSSSFSDVRGSSASLRGGRGGAPERITLDATHARAPSSPLGSVCGGASVGAASVDASSSLAGGGAGGGTGGECASPTAHAGGGGGIGRTIPALPRFYDSEEEGTATGSLVFVPPRGGRGGSSQPGGGGGGGGALSPRAGGANRLSHGQVGSPNNLFLRSSNSSEDGGGSLILRAPSSRDATPPRDVKDAAGGDPELLPYQHRKRLSQGELQQPNIAGVVAVAVPPGGGAIGGGPPPPAPMGEAQGDGNGNSKRPPLGIPPKRNSAGSAGEQAKFKVAAIPAFRGRKSRGGGQGHERSDSEASDNNAGDDGSRGRMRRVKSAAAPSSSSTTARKSKGRSPSPKRPPEKHQQQVLSPQSAAADRDNSRPRPPLAPQLSQEVIDPNQGDHRANGGGGGGNPPPSPRSGGYHIRINSQGSVSSLGSNAGADSVANGGYGLGGAAAPLHHVGMQQQPHAGSNYYHYEREQQQQQQQQQHYGGMQQQQQQYGHHPPHPQHHPQQQQQQQQPQPPRDLPAGVPSVNYNDVLGQEIAHFLHGEQIATANAQPVPQMHYPGRGQPQWHPSHGLPPPQPHGGWHPAHGMPPPPGYGQPWGYPPPLHHQQQQQGYPPNLPPPTEYHPNMQFERNRGRLHSISEDDWEEVLNDGGGGNNGAAQDERDGKYGRQRGYLDREQQQQQQQLQQHHQQQYQPQYHRHYEQDPRMANPYNPPPHSGQGGGRHHERRNSHSRRSSSDGRRRQKSSGGDDLLLPNEQSSLLPPTGIRTYESRDNRDAAGGFEHGDSYHHGGLDHGVWGGGGRQHYHQGGGGGGSSTPRDSKKKRSKRRRREKEKRRQMYSSNTSSEEDELNTSGSNKQQHGKSKKSRGRRSHRKRRSQNPTHGDDSISETYSESLMSMSHTDRSRGGREAKGFFQQLVISTRLLVCNLPLSSAAISFSIVLLGIVWLKWAEELLPSCKEVSFHSSQCAFPEFPGCYFCDEYNRWYVIATRFHTACCYIAGTSVMLFFAKAILCWRVFIDEMSSPTTASPMGLIFMTMALSFVGRGDVGEALVFAASLLHLVLAVWFIYMSLAYQTMPDPSWFPNTIGIGLCAVKIWFYYPLSGHFLMAITLMLTFLYYPISLIRVALNEKMSATICWMNMICPAVSLYSLAIIMEPAFQQERPDISHFQTVQRSIYLPSMTCLFGLCVIGMASSVHGLVVRWKQISREEFSPAHAAYSFPLLMHAVAVQSYRSSLDFFADADAVGPAPKAALRVYWTILAVAGTVIALVCIVTYLAFLLSWTDVDTRDELEPPPPNETSVCGSVTYGESLIQPYVSPTILQANETGTLIVAYDYQNGWSDFVRTGRIPAFGFEPMMGRRMLSRERNALKLFMGGQDVIQEGDEEEGDDVCFENDVENISAVA